MRNLFRHGRFLVPVLLLVALAVLLPAAAVARRDPKAAKMSPTRRGSSETLRKEIAENEARLDRGEKKSNGSGFRIDEDPEGNPYVAGELIVSYRKGATGPAARATTGRRHSSRPFRKGRVISSGSDGE